MVSTSPGRRCSCRLLRKSVRASIKTRMRTLPVGVWLAALGLVATAGCSNPEEPAALAPTVLVKNPFCDVTACAEVAVWAHPWAWPLPQPTRGLKRLGVFNGPVACFRLGPLWEITVRGVDSTGAVTDSTTYPWTPDDPRGVYLAAHKADLRVFAITRTFIPAESHGWELSYVESSTPGEPPLTANLVASDACSPSQASQ